LVAFTCERAGSIGDDSYESRVVLVFGVPSLEDAMRELKARGVEFLHEAPAERPLGRHGGVLGPAVVGGRGVRSGGGPAALGDGDGDGFAFVFGVTVRFAQRWCGGGSGGGASAGGAPTGGWRAAAFDVVAVVAASVIPLVMVFHAAAAGLVQRLMFAVAHVWYADAALEGGG